MSLHCWNNVWMKTVNWLCIEHLLWENHNLEIYIPLDQESSCKYLSVKLAINAEERAWAWEVEDVCFTLFDKLFHLSALQEILVTSGSSVCYNRILVYI